MSRALFLVIAATLAVLALPEPDPTIRFTCPNYSQIRVHRVNWQTRTNEYVRTIPATCGDTTAVTFGYLR
jgi:hypothetical protein